MTPLSELSKNTQALPVAGAGDMPTPTDQFIIVLDSDDEDAGNGVTTSLPIDGVPVRSSSSTSLASSSNTSLRIAMWEAQVNAASSATTTTIVAPCSQGTGKDPAHVVIDLTGESDNEEEDTGHTARKQFFPTTLSSTSNTENQQLFYSNGQLNTRLFEELTANWDDEENDIQPVVPNKDTASTFKAKLTPEQLNSMLDEWNTPRYNNDSYQHACAYDGASITERNNVSMETESSYVFGLRQSPSAMCGVTSVEPNIGFRRWLSAFSDVPAVESLYRPNGTMFVTSEAMEVDTGYDIRPLNDHLLFRGNGLPTFDFMTKQTPKCYYQEQMEVEFYAPPRPILSPQLVSLNMEPMDWTPFTPIVIQTPEPKIPSVLFNYDVNGNTSLFGKHHSGAGKDVVGKLQSEVVRDKIVPHSVITTTTCADPQIHTANKVPVRLKGEISGLFGKKTNWSDDENKSANVDVAAPIVTKLEPESPTSDKRDDNRKSEISGLFGKKSNGTEDEKMKSGHVDVATPILPKLEAESPTSDKRDDCMKAADQSPSDDQTSKQVTAVHNTENQVLTKDERLPQFAFSEPIPVAINQGNVQEKDKDECLSTKNKDVSQGSSATTEDVHVQVKETKAMVNIDKQNLEAIKRNIAANVRLLRKEVEAEERRMVKARRRNRNHVEGREMANDLVFADKRNCQSKIWKEATRAKRKAMVDITNRTEQNKLVKQNCKEGFAYSCNNYLDMKLQIGDKTNVKLNSYKLNRQKYKKKNTPAAYTKTKSSLASSKATPQNVELYKSNLAAIQKDITKRLGNIRAEVEARERVIMKGKRKNHRKNEEAEHLKGNPVFVDNNAAGDTRVNGSAKSGKIRKAEDNTSNNNYSECKKNKF